MIDEALIKPSTEVIDDISIYVMAPVTFATEASFRKVMDIRIN
jgi:hypothetical protein